MTAYRRVDQKSGAALSAFSLFNTRRFPNSYAQDTPLCFPQGEFPRQNPEGSKSTNTSRVRHNPSRTVARVDGADHIYSLPSMAAKRFQADSAAARFTFMNGRFFAPSLMARFRAILLVHAAATAINLD